MTMRVSLAELAAADIQLRPAEAVAIVTELCRQNSSGELRGIPSPGIIRLARDGRVSAEGPMTRNEDGIARAAHLLNDLLPPIDAPAEYRARGGLRLVIARALGTLDLPPYDTLEDFCEALCRFAASDLALTARSLFRAWDQHGAMRDRLVPAPALTISDIRRARRATGLSLDDLSTASGVPAARLRELEWGYLRNWRADEEGREHVIRYARASGLDENIVLSIAWPMIVDASTIIEIVEPAATALVASGPQTLTTVVPIARRRTRPALISWGMALAAAALLALATFSIAVESAEERAPARAQSPTAPAVLPAVPVPVAADTSTKDRQGSRAMRPIAARAPAPAPVRRATPPRNKRRAPADRSFLGRELFRIVIR